MPAPIAEVLPFLTARLSHYARLDPARIARESVLLDLGVQSIQAVLICGEVEDRFAVELDPAMIFEHDTVGGFADAIAARLAPA